MTCTHCATPTTGRFTHRGDVTCGDCFANRSAAELDAGPIVASCPDHPRAAHFGRCPLCEQGAPLEEAS